MVKNTSLIFLLLSFAACVSYAQSSLSDTSYLKWCVYSLADDSMGGRLAGSGYEEKAAIWIAQQLKENKINPFFKKNYYQGFEWTADSVNNISFNVIGTINNYADKTIIIGAHYDHVGMGGKRSRSYGKHNVHNGADDNASGVAAMLYVAAELRRNGSKNYNYLFIAYGAHEPGLFGSQYFVDSNIVNPGSIRLLVNFDMIGRVSQSEPVLFWSSTDTTLNLNNVTKDNNQMRCKEIDLPPGDHTAFADKKTPVLFLTTGVHDDYHKISDDADKINYPGILGVCRIVIETISALK
ncbi:MAG TPA: M28 family peptidase [Bacteroidales bacterium]|nr:M28 family peptidase [Bacteroidales bacterium]